MIESEGNPAASVRRKIPPEEYWPLTSDYLRHGRRNEAWHITQVEWDGQMLHASARLEGCLPSATDGSRAHLSIYSAREIDAQLAIIGIHLKLGLCRKTSEIWLLECEEKCLHVVTDLDDVRFAMCFRTRVTSSGKILVERESDIIDARGGHIRLRSKALMNAPSPS